VGAALAGAAAGLIGVSVLTDRDTRPAATPVRAPALAGESMHVELTAAGETASDSASRSLSGMVAPAIVTLDDAPHITVNATLGNDFRVTLGGNRTFTNPVGSVDGQRITFMIGQGGGAPHKVAWSDKYRFGVFGVPPLSAFDGYVDVIGFIYNKSLDSWLFVGAARGF
jgi:hypothetical protein